MGGGPQIETEGKPISFWEEVKRKLVHLSSFWMVALICLPSTSKIVLFYVFFACFILNLLVEFAYSCRVPVVTPIYDFFFGKMLRGDVRPGHWVVSGAPPVFAAAALVCLLYPWQIAATALGVMLLADTAAALIGRRFGKCKVNGKTWEGFAAFWFFGVAFASAMLWFTGYVRDFPIVGWMIPVAILVAAFAELFEKQLRVDDNLSIPFLVGLLLWLPRVLLYPPV